MSAEVTEAPAALPDSDPELPFDDTDPEDTLAVQSHSEVDRLDPLPDKLKLKNGIEFTVNPMRLRQFLALLRILTRGASGFLASGGLTARDPEEFARQLMMLLLLAIPESEEETIEFVKTLTAPVLTGNPEIDEEISQNLDATLTDPELEDIVLIFQKLVQNEAEDLRSLGNRLRSMMTVATKMGLTNDKPKAA